MKPGDEPLIAQPLADDPGLTVSELCRVFELHADDLIELVEYGVVEPATGRHPAEWRFSGHALVRIRRALRLRHDLAVGPAGAALALDLIEELGRLRARLSVFDPSALRR